MRRRVVIQFECNEIEYAMALTIILRQLQRGQVRGDGVVGGGAWHYTVETEHERDQDAERPPE